MNSWLNRQLIVREMSLFVIVNEYDPDQSQLFQLLNRSMKHYVRTRPNQFILFDSYNRKPFLIRFMNKPFTAVFFGVMIGSLVCVGGNALSNAMAVKQCNQDPSKRLVSYKNFTGISKYCLSTYATGEFTRP